MSERESAWILTNQVNARLTVVHESGRTTIVDGYSFMDDFKHVLGNNSVFDWQNYLVLAGISISGIENAIFNPRAKHATFSKKGNIFSRIAHLIQTGYQFAAAGAVQPQHSGVLFKWEEKDLHKYALKWMNALGKSASGKVAQATDRNNARELALMENEQMTSFYRFVSDTEIKSLSPMEAQTIRSKQEELQKAYRAEHQGAEPGKRVFYL